MVKKGLLLTISLVCIFHVIADTWGIPLMIVAYSENNEYMLKVYPREERDVKFSHEELRQWKKQLKQLPKEIRFAILDSIYYSPCHALLYHISDADTVEIWNRRLVNFGSPIRAIVANDGKSVVTTGDWYTDGGKHVLVVYGETGDLLMNYSLKDISPFPMEQHTLNSTNTFAQWGGEVRYLDNNEIEVLFRNNNGETRAKTIKIEQ